MINLALTPPRAATDKSAVEIGLARPRLARHAATLSPGVAYRYASLWLRNWAELEECIGDFAKPVFAVRRANSNRLIGVNS